MPKETDTDTPQQKPEQQIPVLPTTATIRKKLTKSACGNCKRLHAKCNEERYEICRRLRLINARPCKSCTNKGVPELCVDVPRKTRGT